MGGISKMNKITHNRQYTTAQKLSTSPYLALDRRRWSKKILEISTFDTDRPKPIDTDSSCFLSKKIILRDQKKSTHTKKCWLHSHRSIGFCCLVRNNSHISLRELSGYSQEPSSTLWSHQHTTKSLLSE